MEPKSNSVISTIRGDTTTNNIKGRRPNHDEINKAGDAPHADNDQHHQSEDDEDHQNYDGAITAAAPPTAKDSHIYKKKRSGGAMHILQVAAFLLRRRRRSADKSKPISLALEGRALASSKNTWKRLVGSIRPLHLQSGSSGNPTTPLHSLAAPSENYEDVLPPPMSPSLTDDLSSEDGMSSRYASAVNLQELDSTTEQEEENYNAIDARAEEFIAQFYHQMKLQRLDSIDNRR